MKNLAEQCLDGGREQVNALALLVERINLRRQEIKGKPGHDAESIWLDAFVMEMRAAKTGGETLLSTIKAATSCNHLDRTPSGKRAAAHDYEEDEELELHP